MSLSTCRRSRRARAPSSSAPAPGLPLSSYFSSLKIRWILDHVAGARALAETGDALFGNIDTFLVWQLTGGAHGGLHVTDVTNASRTQLMHLDTLDWDADLLAAFDIPRAMLPVIRSSSERYGTATAEPIEGVPITGILGDQQAALVGQTCFRPGEAKNTYGTGCFLLLNTGESAVRSTHGSADHRRLPHRQRAGALCARGQHRRHRGARPVDPGQPRVDQEQLRRSRRSRARSPTTAASTSCRPSPGSTRPTGTTARGEPSSA